MCSWAIQIIEEMNLVLVVVEVVVDLDLELEVVWKYDRSRLQSSFFFFKVYCIILLMMTNTDAMSAPGRLCLHNITRRRSMYIDLRLCFVDPVEIRIVSVEPWGKVY